MCGGKQATPGVITCFWPCLGQVLFWSATAIWARLAVNFQRCSCPTSSLAIEWRGYRHMLQCPPFCGVWRSEFRSSCAVSALCSLSHLPGPILCLFFWLSGCFIELCFIMSSDVIKQERSDRTNIYWAATFYQILSLYSISINTVWGSQYCNHTYEWTNSL